MRKCHTYICLGVFSLSKKKGNVSVPGYVSVSFGLIPVTSSGNKNENQVDVNRMTNLIK